MAQPVSAWVGDSWGQETFQDFASLFKQSWRLWVRNWASGKLKHCISLPRKGWHLLFPGASCSCPDLVAFCRDTGQDW